MEQSYEQLFQDKLREDEKLLWSGQPERRVYLSIADIFLIPFGLLWLVAAMLGCLVIILNGMMFVWVIWGILMLLAGLYLLFGRFIYKYIEKKHTFYGVSNQRIMILYTLFGKRYRTKYIYEISSIYKRIRSNGIGKVKFKSSLSFGGSITYLSMKTYNRYEQLNNFFAFSDIKDADKVYELVNQLLVSKRL